MISLYSFAAVFFPKTVNIMNNKELTFNDLPQVVAQLRDEVMGMRALLTRQQDENTRLLVNVSHHKYQDELDKWLEANRRNAVPLTTEEENDAILASHRRKPNKRDW